MHAHQTLIDQEHAKLAGPDGENHHFLRDQHPFAPSDPSLPGLRSQLGELLRSEKIRPSTEYDLVERDHQKRVPGEGGQNDPVIGAQPLDPQLAGLRNPKRAIS